MPAPPGSELARSIGCARVVWVEPTKKKGQLAENNGGVVNRPRPNGLLDVMWQSTLKMIQDHACVEHDPFAANRRIGQKREITVGTQGQIGFAESDPAAP